MVSRVAATSRDRAYNLRRGEWTHLDFSTAGGLTISESSVSNATGHAVTQNATGVRCVWTAANISQNVGFKYQPATALDFTNIEGFGIEVDCTDDLTWTTLCSLRVLLCNETGSTFTNYFTKLLNTGVAHYGRRIYWVSKTDFNVGAGSPKWNSIARIEIMWQRQTRNTAVVPLDSTITGFYYGRRETTPTLVWTFDDGDLAQYTEAYDGTTTPSACMRAYGWRGTLYVNSGSIGTGGKMSLTQLKTLRDAGWDVCHHTNSHIANCWAYTPSIAATTVTLNNTASIAHGKSVGDPIRVERMDPIEMCGDFTVASAANAYTLTYNINTPEATTILVGQRTMDHVSVARGSTLAKDIETCMNWLLRNGFDARNLKHYAYPYGYFSDGVINLLRSLGVETARGLFAIGSPQDVGWIGNAYRPKSLDWMRLPAFSLGSTDTASALLLKISSIIKYGGCGILYGHNFVTTPSASREFALSELALLMAGVRLFEQQGLLRVIPLSQYYEESLSDAI